MRANQPEWRKFERLVAQIEEALGPSGAKVTSPDRLLDADGTWREIDATVRLTVGTVPVLIIIECRKRRARQDKTWLEQVSEKRNSLRAARAVAVSASSFSKPARRAAERLGLELRQLQAITLEDISRWCGVKAVVLLNEHIELLSAAVECSRDAGEIQQGFPIDPNAQLFESEGAAKRWSLLALVQEAVSQNKVAFPEAGKPPIEHDFTVHLAGPPVYLRHADGLVQARTLRVKLRLSTRYSEHPASHISEYSGPSGSLAQHVGYDMVVNGVPATLAFARNLESHETKLTITFGETPKGDSAARPRRKKAPPG